MGPLEGTTGVECRTTNGRLFLNMYWTSLPRGLPGAYTLETRFPRIPPALLDVSLASARNFSWVRRVPLPYDQTRGRTTPCCALRRRCDPALWSQWWKTSSCNFGAQYQNHHYCRARTNQIAHKIRANSRLVLPAPSLASGVLADRWLTSADRQCA
jgi:hypothetical protein